IERHLAGKRLVRTLDPRINVLQGDFVLLDTVLVNLLDNAAKHATGASTIEISARTEAGEGLIDVVDDGVGIPPEYLPRLFDKFFRIHRTDTTVAGTGLGLSICKGLVEAMGGRIEVQSPVKNARGSRFTVRLPLGTQPLPIPELSSV